MDLKCALQTPAWKLMVGTLDALCVVLFSQDFMVTLGLKMDIGFCSET
jgi:hypothetical protein